jgi:hypothetical protein
MALSAESYKLNTFTAGLKERIENTNDEFAKVLFSLFLANLDKLAMLKSTRNAGKADNAIVDFKMNIQHLFSHSNYANVDEYGVLLQLFTKDGDNRVFEIEEGKLSEIINKLKEIYNKIKIN